MSSESRRHQALEYHATQPAGKIEVVPTKNVASQVDLSLAYSPGVAVPCEAIRDSVEDVYKYTAKGNLVAVISNGTAVLGLGNIGPEASKPVMEGKGVLFKRFAGIDVFDLEVNETDPDKFIAIVKSLEPTFGGINLEDIKAPESFKIEKELQRQMHIPVMHDDQHGTAIISAAALLNALQLVDKKIDEIRLVVNGAGAAALACVELYLDLGVRKDNIILLDSSGVLHKEREDLSAVKRKYASDTPARSLLEAMEGADMFLGLSRGDVLEQDMILRMARDPIVFALANPDPEIKYELAKAARKDIIMATGRSDHPNQVNNVLGFPYIFRGALDVRATCINGQMKIAAVKALSELAQKLVPEPVLEAYGLDKITFGPDYLIPKPLDPRLITAISSSVAKAAIETGVARVSITDWESYERELKQRIGVDSRIMARVAARQPENKIKKKKRIVFSGGNHIRVLEAAHMVAMENIGLPILLGDKAHMESLIKEYKLGDENMKLVNPHEEKLMREELSEDLFHKRQRKGMAKTYADSMLYQPDSFGLMMLESGHADVFVGGIVSTYVDTLSVALQIVGKKKGVGRIGAMHVIASKRGTFFLADTSVNVSLSSEELADLVGLVADTVRLFDFEPRVALLSYTNFSSAKGEIPLRIRDAVALSRQRYPDLVVEGDIHADVALSRDMLRGMYEFSLLDGEPANTLIFPDLSSGNIATKLLVELGDFEMLGPLLMGMRKPVCIMQNNSSVRDIFNMVSLITALP
ncbi:MAG: NADP-dependent malic enzyme [Cytophagales bacterium]|nr:NADP-dependent malic enzyme [Cytophagales bacterium]